MGRTLEVADRDALPRLRAPERLARRPARACRRVRRHRPLHGRLPRPGSGRATGSTSSRRTAARTGRSRCTAAAAPMGIRAGCPRGAARPTRRRGSWSRPCPRRFTVVSNGRLVSDRAGARRACTRPRGGRRSRPRPISSRWPWRRSSRSPTAGAVFRWITTSILRTARWPAPLFGATPDMMETYGRLTGVPYPWNKYAQVTVADFIGGMENVSATTLVDWLPDRRAYLDRPWYRRVADPARAGPPVVRRPGHRGELGQLLAQRGHGRVHAGPVLGRQAGRARGAGLLPGRVPAVLGGRRAPPDAARHLQLQQRLPQGRAGARDAEDAARGRSGSGRRSAATSPTTPTGSATSDDLRQAVLEATGQSLGWFWSQWMYRGGVSGVQR